MFAPSLFENKTILVSGGRSGIGFAISKAFLEHGAWWVAWAPFVGMFIARISKGRTFKEFVLGVLFVPTLMTFFLA